MTEAGTQVLSEITSFVVDKIQTLAEEDIESRLISHYVRLRLLNSTKGWATPDLDSIGDKLLPKKVSSSTLEDFIKEIAGNLENNPYFMNFLGVLSIESLENFNEIEENLDMEGTDLICDVVTFAYALEQLTTTICEDTKIVKSLKDTWQEYRGSMQTLLKENSLFYAAKFLSVELAMDKIMKFRTSEKVPEDFSKIVLPGKILEAVAQDMRLGNRDNAYAGEILAAARPNSKKFNAESGVGPAELDKETGEILTKPPLTKQWDDLYQTWNMCFVTTLYNWPYMISKLLITRVSKYHEKPNAYMMARVNALYIVLHFDFFQKKDLDKDDEVVNWNDKHLTKLWGAENKKSAVSFDKELDKYRKEENEAVKRLRKVLPFL